MFTYEYQKMLHARSMNNRGALLDSRECGCFFCIKMFTPDKITDWPGDERILVLRKTVYANEKAGCHLPGDRIYRR